MADASSEVEVFRIYTKQYGDEYQSQLKVGVQTFMIGPRYETEEEADWMGDQLIVAMESILRGYGVDGTVEGLPRMQ